MTALAREHCEACDGSTPVASDEDVARLRGDLSEDWSVADGERLHRSLRFKDFSAAFAMATRVALLAEAEGHHPEMTVGWGHLDIELTTHAAGGLTRNDFILAARIDALLS
ncbi:MAG: 4a-hydroxytetrahydrobiopterin dehydratase [Candidatus Dormibacteria bacterium]